MARGYYDSYSEEDRNHDRDVVERYRKAMLADRANELEKLHQEALKLLSRDNTPSILVQGTVEYDTINGLQRQIKVLEEQQKFQRETLVNQFNEVTVHDAEPYFGVMQEPLEAFDLSKRPVAEECGTDALPHIFINLYKRKWLRRVNIRACACGYEENADLEPI